MLFSLALPDVVSNIKCIAWEVHCFVRKEELING